jgi:hypothetical protein
MNRRLILLGIIFLVAAGLAYYLEDLVRSILFEPLSYLLWGLNLVYLSIAQLVYWVLLVIGVTLMAFGSLYGGGRTRKQVEDEKITLQGPLQTTAGQISRTGRGVYYQWIIANRLGKLATSILTLRTGKAEYLGDEIDAEDWKPPDEVAAYLVSGLTRTFADFPRRRWYFRPQKTPFDIDLDQVTTYLESQMENQRD